MIYIIHYDILYFVLQKSFFKTLHLNQTWSLFIIYSNNKIAHYILPPVFWLLLLGFFLFLLFFFLTSTEDSDGEELMESPGSCCSAFYILQNMNKYTWFQQATHLSCIAIYVYYYHYIKYYYQIKATILSNQIYYPFTAIRSYGRL